MRAYIISLSNVPASTKTALNLRNSLMQYGIDSELYDGIDGHSAKMMVIKEHRNPHPIMHDGNLITETHRQRISKPGVIGCFYSHYHLWKKCVELDEPIMIFEDDAVLTRDFIPVDWDGVLLLCMGFEWKVSHGYLKYLENPTGNSRVIKYKGTCIPGAVGYAIKPNAARTLCEVYADTYDAADLAINTNNVPVYHHSHLMGRALVKADGKVSMTKTNYWGN